MVSYIYQDAVRFNLCISVHLCICMRAFVFFCCIQTLSFSISCRCNSYSMNGRHSEIFIASVSVTPVRRITRPTRASIKQPSPLIPIYAGASIVAKIYIEYIIYVFILCTFKCAHIVNVGHIKSVGTTELIHSIRHLVHTIFVISKNLKLDFYTR